LVLWVLTILSVIVGEFCHAMRTEVNITRNFKERTQAYYIALAGINRAISELIRNEVIPRKVKSTMTDKGKETGLNRGIGRLGVEEGARWRINVTIPPVPYGEGQFEVRIGNESGKININRANESMLKMMFGRFDLAENESAVIADSILDWRDTNDLHRLNGAENDYYRSLPKPYKCKNGDFDTVEELLMVRGITPELFYGGLKDMVTVRKDSKLSRKVSFGNEGAGKININAASRDILLALPMMADDLVDKIMGYRKESDFISLNDVALVVGTGVYQAILPFISLKTLSYYTITSVGKLEGSQVRQGIEALVDIDSGPKKRCRIVQWCDRSELGEQSPKSEK